MYQFLMLIVIFLVQLYILSRIDGLEKRQNSADSVGKLRDKMASSSVAATADTPS